MCAFGSTNALNENCYPAIQKVTRIIVFLCFARVAFQNNNNNSINHKTIIEWIECTSDNRFLFLAVLTWFGCGYGYGYACMWVLYSVKNIAIEMSKEFDGSEHTYTYTHTYITTITPQWYGQKVYVWLCETENQILWWYCEIKRF